MLPICLRRHLPMNTAKRDLTLTAAHLANHALGRVEELHQLHEKLHATRQPLVITGIGGLGKTTLAQMYWQQHRREYDCAAWLSAYALFTSDDQQRPENAEIFLRAFLDNQALKASLALVFDPQQPPVEHFQQIIAALADMDGQHLLVIDNVPEAAAAYLPQLSALPHWRILLTSRDAIPNTTKMELEVLSPDEASELFERIYEQPARSVALSSLLDHIGYHTLTIELLAAYAREKPLDPPGLLALIRAKGLAQLDDLEVTTPRYHQSRDIAAHLRQLFLLELHSEEQEILRYCAILPTSNVLLDPALCSEDQLCTLFGKKERGKDFKKRLRRLTRLHWLVEKGGGYRCHPVIAETAKAQLLPDAVNCQVLIENVTDLLIPDEKTNESILNRARFAPLAEAVFKGVWKEAGDFVEADDVVARLAAWLADLFRSLGEAYQALEYGQRVIAIREKVLPPEHPDLAQSYNNLAETYGALGEHQKRLEYNLKDIAICEKVLPPEHPDLATSYNNLALTYGALGEHQKSLEYNLKALAILEKVLPPEHPSLASSYNNLALTYGALGEHQKSLEYNLKALAICEKVLPPEHPDLATSYNNLAETYGALGEHQKRLEYNLKALFIWEKALPSEHPYLATSYNNLAATYGALGKHEKDLEYSQKALAIREKVLPSQHPDFAQSYNNIAITYHALGDLEKAIAFMRRAVIIWEKSLPAAHPHLVAAKNSLELMDKQRYKY